MQQTQPYDRSFFVSLFLLLFLGVVLVLNASCARALHTYGDELYFFKRQAIWGIIGLVAILGMMNLPYWWWRRWAFPAFVLALALVILVLIPGVGSEVNGSRRWLRFAGLSLQPSELAKLAMVLGLAAFGDRIRTRIQSPFYFWTAVALAAMLTLPVAAEDLGTAISMGLTALVLIYAMGARPRHLMTLAGLAAAGGVALILVKPYRMQRVTAWLDLVFNPLDIHSGPAYQPAQGLIALGSGGVGGNGIGRGYSKFLYLPAEHTDYIFATIGEEIGLIGCLAIIILFCFLVGRGLHIAFQTRDRFGSLFACGLSAMVGSQALLNIAVVTGLVPCTGVPLPFISYGGSSVLFTAIGMGMVLNISRYPGRAGETERAHRRRPVRATNPERRRHGRPHLSRS